MSQQKYLIQLKKSLQIKGDFNMWYTIPDSVYPQPPSNEAEVFDKCCNCGEKLYIGYDFYDIYGEYFCEDCVDKIFKKQAIVRED